MSREAFGDPPGVDDQAVRCGPAYRYLGRGRGWRKQKAAFEKHCTGDCGKNQYGRRSTTEVTGRPVRVLPTDLPLRAKVANYGSTAETRQAAPFSCGCWRPVEWGNGSGSTYCSTALWGCRHWRRMAVDSLAAGERCGG